MTVKLIVQRGGTMNPLDTLKTGAAGLVEKITGENPKLLQEVFKMVQAMPDGFSGLMKQFQDKGLGTIVASLTGKGPAQTITPEQVVLGFGPDRIKTLATSTGLDVKAIPGKLAELLPKVAEKFNPVEAFAGKK
jgi:uncharacterized protein YidB (DUF937 family)